MKKLLLLMVIAGGCAPSYWVQESDLVRARRGYASSVPATRVVGDDPLQLKAASLEGVGADEDRGQAVRVTPQHTKLKVGWALLGIGAGLAVGGLIAGLSSMAPCTGDENCWLPQLIAGSTLGGFGGASMLIGGAIAGTSLHDAEVRN